MAKAINLLNCPTYQARAALVIADPPAAYNEPRRMPATLLRQRLRLNQQQLSEAAEATAARNRAAQYLQRPAFHQLVSDLEVRTGFQFWQLFLDTCNGVRMNRIKCRVAARRLWWQAMRDAGMSFPEIGAATGVSHSTVLEALKLCRGQDSI